MKRHISILVLVACLAAAGLAYAQGMQGHDQMKGAFRHEGVAEGIKADFEVMSLASMNMPDASGATHHVMVKLFREDTGAPIADAVGRVKVISPTGQEAVVDLKDYNGTYAANFTAREPGRYGIIVLLKADGKKPLYKFWYPYQS